MATKQCSKCAVTKPVDDFYWQTKTYRKPWCKACDNARKAAAYAKKKKPKRKHIIERQLTDEQLAELKEALQQNLYKMKALAEHYKVAYANLLNYKNKCVQAQTLNSEAQTAA